MPRSDIPLDVTIGPWSGCQPRQHHEPCSFSVMTTGSPSCSPPGYFLTFSMS